MKWIKKIWTWIVSVMVIIFGLILYYGKHSQKREQIKDAKMKVKESKKIIKKVEKKTKELNKKLKFLKKEQKKLEKKKIKENIKKANSSKEAFDFLKEYIKKKDV
tara:strand:- start:1240 stop:1554 length:315 start_codon:yes stop_codon:yes gene_type:complete